MILTFENTTFNICSALAVTWPNHADFASPLRLSLGYNRHIIAIPKFKDGSRDLGYAPST